MMVTRPYFTEFVDAQREVLADARKLYEALRSAEAVAAAYPGWMFWKRYPTGRRYLVHAYDRTGRGTTLGGETPENEQRLEEFKQEQEEAKTRLKIMKQRAKEHARFVKAARLNRFPRTAAALLRAIERDPARKPVVVNAFALFAYELRLGVLFAPRLIEIDTLTVALHSNTAASEGELSETRPTFAQFLHQADRTIALDEKAMIAVSDAGLRVHFLDHEDAAFVAEAGPLARSHPLTYTGPDRDPAPIIREMVIDQDGAPLDIAVPDPRVFAAHQYLLAESVEVAPESRARHQYLADAVTEALHAQQGRLPPVEPLSSTSATTRLGTILNDVVLARTKPGAS